MDATTLKPHHPHHAFPASWTGNRMLAVCFAFIITIYTSALHAQCTTQVTNTSGTTLIGCTQVTAVPFGGAGVLPTYCPATTPYFIGYNFTGGSVSRAVIFLLFLRRSALSRSMSVAYLWTRPMKRM